IVLSPPTVRDFVCAFKNQSFDPRSLQHRGRRQPGWTSTNDCSAPKGHRNPPPELTARARWFVAPREKTIQVWEPAAGTGSPLRVPRKLAVATLKKRMDR